MGPAASGKSPAVLVVLVLCSLSPTLANKHNQIDSAPMGECQMLNQIQANVIKILNTHYDYGRQIHLLRQVVEGLEKDISVFKTSLDDLDSRQTRLEDIDAQSVSGSSGFDAKGMVHSIEKSISNLTLTIGQQDDHYQQLDKKYKRLRRMMSKVTTSVGQVENSVVGYMDESRTLEHFLKSQKDINSNLIHRIQFLERNIQLMKPQQDPPVITQEHDCPQGFVRHFMSCYKFENFTANWIEAEKHCQGLHEGAHLVSIESEEETDFMIRYRKYNEAHWTSAYLWTGGNDMSKEGAWSWVGSGRVLTYTDWQDGEPDNHRGAQHCIYLRAAGKDHRWDDWHCYAARLNFVCEINLVA